MSLSPHRRLEISGHYSVHDASINSLVFGEEQFEIHLTSEDGETSRIIFPEVLQMSCDSVWAGNIISGMDIFDGKNAPEKIIEDLIRKAKSRETVTNFQNRVFAAGGYISHIYPSYGAEIIVCSRELPRQEFGSACDQVPHADNVKSSKDS